MKAPARSLLRWYPEQWRARYGAEFVALMEDDLSGRKPTVRFRISIAFAGLRERGHQVGLSGDGAPAPERSRTGSLLVLCAWTAFVIAGISFTKLAEHFQQAVSGETGALSTAAYDTVFVLAILGGVLVVTGAALALPAFMSFLRAGGWPTIRGHVHRGLLASALALGALVSVRYLAQGLTVAERNGSDAWYSAAFLSCAAVVVATIWLWTGAAVAIGRRLVLPVAVLRAEAILAVFVAAAMVLMTSATALWWAAVASGASWFLQGVRPGTTASSFDPNLVVTMSLMLIAVAIAGYGVERISRSWRHPRVR